MRINAFCLALVVMSALLPDPATAQRQSCDLSYAGSTSTMYGGTQNEMSFLGGGVRLVCDGGTTIAADSAVRMVLNNRLEFIRNVRYADSVRTLTSDYLQYLGQERLIVAQGNVVLRQRDTGSTLRGPFLSYYMTTETRPEEVLQMPQGRPVALLVRERADTMAAVRDTTQIVANLIEIIGESRFVGRGNVEIERSDLQAFAAEVNYAEATNTMRLNGAARVETERYTLHGDTIIAEGEEDSDGSDFREVEARRNARLLSDEMTVEAPGIRVFFEAGEVDRLVAVGDTARAGVQAVAISPDFRLEADSIDALAPGQRLETVTAVGTAYGVRTVEDSLSVDEPELIRHDWVRGDTVIAHFTDPPPATTAADTTAPQRVLERLDALGALGRPATSLYRMRNEAEGGFAVNYLRARHIAVYLEDGEVRTVEADDAVHGLYLRPPARTGGAGDATNGRTGGVDRQ